MDPKKARAITKAMLPKEDILLNDLDIDYVPHKELQLDDELPQGDSEDQEKMGEEDYQYTLEYISTDESGSGSEDGEVPKDMYKLIRVVPIEEIPEEELEGGEEFIDDMEELDTETEEPMEKPNPIINRESVNSNKKSIKEEAELDLEELNPENDESEKDTFVDEPEEELESVDAEAEYEFNKEEFIKFMDSQEFESNLYIDEDTEFNVEEALDYLKLYPDDKIYIKVDEMTDFEKSIDEFKAKEEEFGDEVEDEEQHMAIDMETLESPDQEGIDNTENKQELPMESFSIFKLKNKKNLPDGIYIGNLNEGKLFGSFNNIKITSSFVMINEEKFYIEKLENLQEAKGKSEIEFKANESSTLLNYLNNNAEIIVKL